MGLPMSPSIEFDVTVLEECRDRTFVTLQDAQQQRTFDSIAISIDLESDMIYFHNFLCGRTKTGGPAVISGTMAGSLFVSDYSSCC
jgi:hypothetical protein